MSFGSIVDRPFVILSIILAIAGCAPGSRELTRPDAREPELPTYNTAVVLDFDDATDDPKTFKGDQLQSYRSQVAEVCRWLPGAIAQRLRNDEVFDAVIRGPHEIDGLRIHGEITEYRERLYLYGVIVFSDNRTGQLIGEIDVRPNELRALGSILLGGPAYLYMADFIDLTAEKVVEEILEARRVAE